ncbi:MAG TPA: hypothetical protein VG308_14100 [Stellaceae bacterium]|nr:hypothetical protein [Stellaceae bacterium]
MILVGAWDGVLRSCYSVTQFTDDPRCVLRIGRGSTRHGVRFADGSEIHAGETIGTLHFWNEQLPPFSRGGPDLRWAATMHRRVLHSLRELARFVETDPDWRDIRAFRGEAALSSRLGAVQLRRVIEQYGFECAGEPASWLRQLHDLGECFTARALTRAYNPNALPRQRFFRPYHDLWLSRATLIARHGARRRGR